MLHLFLTGNREEIVARTRARIAAQIAPHPVAHELVDDLASFLDQFIAILQAPAQPSYPALLSGAAAHARRLLREGFPIAQIVYDYGDLCQVVTALAQEANSPIRVDEFQCLNQCLDDAIRQAVTEYERQRDLLVLDAGTERLGVLAHELRNRLGAAMTAFDLLRCDGAAGSTPDAILGRNLRRLRDLIDRATSEVRLESAIQQRERLCLSDFVEEIEAEACLEASARGVHFMLGPVATEVDVQVDRQLLALVVLNLLQNAFKFSHPQGCVSLTVKASDAHALIEIEDECGGLPPGSVDTLFRPFEQRSVDRSGLGLGLSISRKGTEANGGELRVRDLPGKGCVFTIDLPRTPGTSDKAHPRPQPPAGTTEAPEPQGR